MGVTQKPEDPEKTNDWERDKLAKETGQVEKTAAEAQRKEDPEKTDDWERDKN